MKVKSWFRPLFAIAAASALFLVGCSSTPTETASGGTTGGTPVTPTEAGKKFKIGVSLPAADHGWTAGAIWWANQAKEMYPDAEWNIQTAENPEKQIKDLETMMAQGVDAVVILAVESGPVTPTAEELHKRGILVVNVDRGFSKPVADIFIEGDNKAFGRKSAEFIAEKLHGTGKVVAFRGVPCTVDTDRFDSAMEVFKKFPGIEVLDSQPGNWDKQKSLDVMQTYLVKHSHIDAVWAADDDMLLGAEQAIKEAGRQKEMWLVGGGGMKDVVKRIMDKDPAIAGSTGYPPSMTAYAMQQAISTLKGGKEKVLQFTPRHIVMDVELITPDNAKNFYFSDSQY